MFSFFVKFNIVLIMNYIAILFCYCVEISVNTDLRIIISNFIVRLIYNCAEVSKKIDL